MHPYDQMDFPGANFVNESKVIATILKDLAPELLENPATLRTLYAYVLASSDHNKPTFTHLRKILKKTLHVNSKSNLETILDVLKGAEQLAKAMSLESFPDFDQELQIRKEKMESILFSVETGNKAPVSHLNIGKNY